MTVVQTYQTMNKNDHHYRTTQIVPHSHISEKKAHLRHGIDCMAEVVIMFQKDERILIKTLYDEIVFVQMWVTEGVSQFNSKSMWT